MKLISITNQSKVWDKNFIRHVSVFGQSAIQTNQESILFKLTGDQLYSETSPYDEFSLQRAFQLGGLKYSSNA